MQWARLDPGLLDLMWQPVVSVGDPPWEEAMGLGWAVGSYRGHRTLSHSGADPGFGSRLVLVPERRTGVVVLANSNTVPASPIAKAALDIALADVPLSVISSVTPDESGEGAAAMRALLPPVVGPVAETLTTSGPDAAKATFHRLAELEPAEFDLDDEGFEDAVWGAIELHRTSMVWPLLRVWTELRPGSSAAWTMTGWAHQVDGEPDLARSLLQRALDLDPENHDAALIMSGLPRRDPQGAKSPVDLEEPDLGAISSYIMREGQGVVGVDPDFATYAAARWASLVRSAVFLGCSREDAQDLAQVTLLRCYVSWAKVQRADDRDAYVYRVLLNCLRDSRRRRWWGERPHRAAAGEGRIGHHQRC